MYYEHSPNFFFLAKNTVRNMYANRIYKSRLSSIQVVSKNRFKLLSKKKSSIQDARGVCNLRIVDFHIKKYTQSNCTVFLHRKPITDLLNYLKSH